MTDEEIEKWIEQLRGTDFSKQLIALGRLVEAGEAAVPQLFTALAHYPEARMSIVFALAGIAPRDSQVIQSSIQVWEANLTDPLINQALLNWVRKLAAQENPENIPALICFLGCWRKRLSDANGTPYAPGKDLSLLAAQALAVISYNHPVPELLQALPHMKGSFFLDRVPEKMEVSRKIIERHTAHLKDLPLVAEAPKTSGNLPLPSGSEKVDLDG